MKIKPLSSECVRLPDFLPTKKVQYDSANISNTPLGDSDSAGMDLLSEDHVLTLFNLSSHQRAREAIHLGLKMRDKGFHVFVVGEDRSGRMTSTLAYLNEYIKSMPVPADWLYLNNFDQPHRPKPYSMPAGKGRVFAERLKDLVKNIKTIINKTLSGPQYLKQIDALSDALQSQIDEQVADVKNLADKYGYDVIQIPEGFNVQAKEEAPVDIDKSNTSALQEIRDKLNKLSLTINLANQKTYKKAEELKKNTVQKAINPLLQKFQEEFGEYLFDWVDEFKKDVLKHIDDFLDGDEEGNEGKIPFNLPEWYSANLFIDNGTAKHPKVILESRPTYSNLFGSIKYRTGMVGGVETNFTLIRPGSLHEANGGILVLRADALAKDPDAWEALKAALRDRKIVIEEPHRENTLPLVDAPEPHSIPLDVQVFLVASPHWYYTFFFNDPDFRAYFKIKADIDPDLPATPENIEIYHQLIHQHAKSLTGKLIEQDAVNYLTSYSARWAAHREKLSARFELVTDMLEEAAALSEGNNAISKRCVETVLEQRRRRNASGEDRTHEDITSGQILIDSEGTVVGQVNALSVLSTGDHNYGMPNRISARTYCGEEGVVNIERLTDMSGPIQQKGALILEGFLKALFAQKYPLSCACSLTFEQSYMDVEGDSASMAELVAIISSLSGFSVRQDIAITGSMNQFGSTQAVGGIHYKIEGFHRVCKERGLTGTQGVIIPSANCVHLTLRESVIEDIVKKKFFIWPVDSVFEAMELLMSAPCGIPLQDGIVHGKGYPYYSFTANSIFAAALKQLERYYRAAQKNRS